MEERIFVSGPSITEKEICDRRSENGMVYTCE